MKWEDVTVFQWQQLGELFSSETDEFELNIKSAAILHNMTENEINNLNVSELHKLISDIDFMHEDIKHEAKRFIDVNGRRYRCVYDITKLPAARYIESKHYGKDVNGNLHKIMACMVMPQRKNILGRWVDDKYQAEKHNEYAEDMLQAKIINVLGSVLFFCNVYIHWIANSRDYLVSQMETTMTKKEAEETYRDLWNSMVGFIKPNWLHDMKGLN